MSHDKGFHFLDVYCAFDEKTHLFKDGLNLNDEGAGILSTSVSLATQVHFWTKKSQPTSSGNGEGIPSPTEVPYIGHKNIPPH